MVEVFRTQQMEVALDAYRTWVDRSIKFGFYPASVALTYDGKWSILIVEALREAYFSTLLSQ